MRAPDLDGPRGQAWLVRDDETRAMYAKTNRKVPPTSTVVWWLIHAPGYHPWWNNYQLSLIHLRPVDGLPPAKINLPGATHEVMLFAMSPDSQFSLESFMIPLSPANFFGQFIAHDDESAAEKIKETVNEILIGSLSPDTDYVREWVKRFSDSNLL